MYSQVTCINTHQLLPVKNVSSQIEGKGYNVSISTSRFIMFRWDSWNIFKYIYMFNPVHHAIRYAHELVVGCLRISIQWHLNSLAPGGFENIFQNVFFKLISWIDTLSNSCEIALRSMPQNPSDDKSTLVQVMAWCRQAASHYLSQCCPRSLSPYGVTRPQWVNRKLLIFLLENVFENVICK